MFPDRYFPTRFFASRYWAKIGAAASSIPEGITRLLDLVRIGTRNMQVIEANSRSFKAIDGAERELEKLS